MTTCPVDLKLALVFSLSGHQSGRARERPSFRPSGFFLSCSHYDGPTRFPQVPFLHSRSRTATLELSIHCVQSFRRPDLYIELSLCLRHLKEEYDRAVTELMATLEPGLPSPHLRSSAPLHSLRPWMSGSRRSLPFSQALPVTLAALHCCAAGKTAAVEQR